MSNSDPSSSRVPIGPGLEEESFVEREAQLEKQIAERTRLENCWAKVRDWHSDDSDPNGFYAFALALHNLVHLLQEQGLAARLDNLPPGPNAKERARQIYNLAGERNNVEAIAAALKDIEDKATHSRGEEKRKWELFLLKVKEWLRHGLMKEILEIPPELSSVSTTGETDCSEGVRAIMSEQFNSPFLKLDRRARQICSDELLDLTRQPPPHPVITSARRQNHRAEAESAARSANKLSAQFGIPFSELDPRLKAVGRALMKVTSYEGPTWPQLTIAHRIARHEELLQQIESCYDAAANLYRLVAYYRPELVESAPHGIGPMPPTWDIMIDQLKAQLARLSAESEQGGRTEGAEGESATRDQGGSGQDERDSQVTTSVGVADDERSGDKLADRQLLILETMLAHAITSERRRKSQSCIVQQINHTHNHQTYSRDFAALVKCGYLLSREGPGGGMWINPKRKADVEHILKGN
jgi:hypothetical protein